MARNAGRKNWLGYYLVVGAAASIGVLIATGAAPAAAAGSDRLPSWESLTIPVKTARMNVSAVDSKIAWVGGLGGVVLRTVDGGQSWENVSPPGAGELDFRDVQAFSADRALAMSADDGSDARTYLTDDGGRTWRLTYQSPDPKSYFDCMSFSDDQRGLLLGDPVDGKFVILSTDDGGRSWVVLPSAGMPPARAAEYDFAASGECMTTLGTDAWFGTNGKDGSRIFHSTDGGLTWDVTQTSIAARPYGGIYGLAFRSSQVGIAVGGIKAQPDRAVNVAAITSGDGIWRKPEAGPYGIRAGIDFVPGRPHTAITVGLSGSDISYDDGDHWAHFADGQFTTVDCVSDGSCWAAGWHGRVAILHW